MVQNAEPTARVPSPILNLCTEEEFKQQKAYLKEATLVQNEAGSPKGPTNCSSLPTPKVATSRSDR